MARAQRKKVDATDHQIGQDGIVNMSTIGEAVLDKPDIEIVDGPQWKDRAAELAFMEERVEVMVHESSNENEEDIVSVWCNGRRQNFIRGVPVVVKRKFVERLARAKPTSYKNEEFVDHEGAKSVRWPKKTTLRYPFSVIRDENPRGAPWLRKVLAEA